MTEQGTLRGVLRNRILTAFLLAAFSAVRLSALEPPTREQLARYKADGTMAMRAAMARSYGNHLLPNWSRDRLVDRLNRLNLKKRGLRDSVIDKVLAPPAAWKGMPTTGNVKVLALLIDFSDYPGANPVSTFESKLFGEGDGGIPWDSLKNYYARSSYNQLAISGNVLGWYRASDPRSEVMETDAGREALIMEALSYYDARGHDFSQYDNDGDGSIDYFCVFWAGPHGDWAEFWWGYYTAFSDRTYKLDGKRLNSYSWQWENYNYPASWFDPQTIIHETGHALGVPDYYDYDDTVGPDGGVGGLDIMDGNVGDHNCFSKFMLGWMTPTVVTSGPQTVSLRASGLYGDALLFMPDAENGKIFGEYFMVQNRYRTANDRNLFTGSDGLLVWHVDARLNGGGTDYLYDNSYSAHKLLKLMQADGLGEIELNYSADADDYYKAGATFSDSDRYDGVAIGMGIWNITGTTSPMSVDVFSNDAKPTCAITNLAEGQLLYGTVAVTVDADDDNSVTKVELYGDNTLLGTLTAAPWTFSVDTSALGNGTRVIKAKAYDTLNQTGSGSVPVVLENIFVPLSAAAKKAYNRGALIREIINVLTWSDNAGNTTVTGYRIYVNDGSGEILLAEVAAGSVQSVYQYPHRRVTSGRTYSYRIVGVNGAGREGTAVVLTAR